MKLSGPGLGLYGNYTLSANTDSKINTQRLRMGAHLKINTQWSCMVATLLFLLIILTLSVKVYKNTCIHKLFYMMS